MASKAEEAAEQAEEAADAAEELAGDVGDSEYDGPAVWHHRPPRPPRPPRAPHPPHPHHHVHHGPEDHYQWRDPAERLQDRVEQVIQRFEVMRDGADRLIRAAERMFPAGRAETVPAKPDPGGPADPA